MFNIKQKTKEKSDVRTLRMHVADFLDLKVPSRQVAYLNER